MLPYAFPRSSIGTGGSTEPIMPITLVRHTAVEVDEGLCYGQSDVPLKNTFPEEADRVVSRLGELPAIDRLISSPLSRCRKLAERIADSFQLPLAFDDRFKELDFGVWEGRLWSDIDRQEMNAWMSSALNSPSNTGESLQMLYRRVHQGLTTYSGDEHCVCVTHAGVIKAAFARDEVSTESWYKNIEYGAVVQL